MKLSELVNSALEDAKTKIASAQDVEKTAGFDDVAKAVGSKARDIAHGSGRGVKALTEPGAFTRGARKVVSKAQEIGRTHLKGTGIDSDTGRGLMAMGAAGTAAAGTTAAGAAGAHHLYKKHKSKSESEDGSEKSSADEMIATATEAMKFAESLEHLAMLFPKLASTQINDISGPATLVSPDKGATKDTPTKATSLSAREASTGSDGSKGMTVATNKGEAPYAAKAAQAILEAKIAQSNALLVAGQAKQAAALAKSAQLEFEAAKRAYDEDASTPKGNPETLGTNRNGGFPVPGNVPADNAGMIALTKRQAKTDDVRASASAHLSEPALSAASDRGLTDNVEHTEGAKIANIFMKAAARKSAAASLTDYLPVGSVDTASLDPKVQHQLAHRASMISGAGLGLEGGVLGGMAGHALGGTRGALLGSAAGATLGGLAGYGLGRGAHGLQYMIDKNRQETKGQGVVAGKLQRTGPLSAALHGAIMGPNTMASPEEMAAAAQAPQKMAASYSDFIAMGPDTAALSPEAYAQMAHRGSLAAGASTGLGAGLLGAVGGAEVAGLPGAVLGGVGGLGLGALGGYGAGRLGFAQQHAINAGRESTRGQGVLGGKLAPQGGPVGNWLSRKMLGDEVVASPEAVQQAALASQGSQG